MWPVWCHPPFRDSQKVLRWQVQQMRFAITAGHQCFLPDNNPLTNGVSKIPRSCFTQERACVTIPKEVLSEEFFTFLNESMQSSPALCKCVCVSTVIIEFPQLNLIQLKLYGTTRNKRNVTRRDMTPTQKEFKEFHQPHLEKSLVHEN